MSKLRPGQIVYIDDPGFPYDDWNGISCTVEVLTAGAEGRYVQVRPIIPLKGNEHPATALFHPETVKPETRPWLKRNLKEIVRLRRNLLRAADRIRESLANH